MECILAGRFEKALASRAKNREGSGVYRASVAGDPQKRTGSTVTGPRGFQELGRFLEPAAALRTSIAKETAMIESACEHGPFDSRYPRKHSRLTFVPASSRRSSTEEVADRLDWQAFSSRFFAGRDRHDVQVLEAYEAYRNGSQAFELDRDGSQACETHRREAALSSASLQAWEGEGGAPLEPRAPSRRLRAAVQAPARTGIA